MQPGDSRYTSGISCSGANIPAKKQLIITLAEDVRIIGDGQAGIKIQAGDSAEISVQAQGPSTSVTGGRNQHGVHVTDDSGKRKEVNLSVSDVTGSADGIRVTGIRGLIDIKSSGTIRVSGEASDADSNGAVHVRLEDNSFTGNQETKISVHDIFSTVANPAGYETAGVLVDSLGKVTVSSTGKISTTGDDIGGVKVTLNDGQVNPGPVNIAVNDVETAGNRSHAVSVLRYAREGDVVRVPISIAVNGDVRTSGWESHGIAVEGFKTEIDVTVRKDGSIHVGKAKPGWEKIDAYTAEPIAKAVYVKDFAGDRAIASVSIKNYGTVTGEIYAQSCNAPEFTNSGTFNSGSDVDLILYDDPSAAGCGRIGADSVPTAGKLTNLGILSPGGIGTIAGTEIRADYVQSQTGLLELDVDWSEETADSVTVDGRATLSGSLRINPLALFSPQKAADLNEGEPLEILVMSVSGGITGLPAVEAADSLLLKRGVRKDVSGTKLFVWASVDNNIKGLNQNQRNVLSEVTAAYSSSSVIRSVYVSLLDETVLSSLQFELDGLGNEIAGVSIQAGIRSLFEFAGAVPSCLEDLDTSSQMALCTEITGTAVKHSRERSFEERGHRARFNRFLTAAAWTLDDAGAGLELSLGIDRGHTEIRNLASSNIQEVQAGLTLFGTAGPVSYRATAAASAAKHRISRVIPFNSQISAGLMRTVTRVFDAEAAYPVAVGSLTVSPFAGFSAASYRSGPYTETGAGDLSLKVNGVSGRAVETRMGIGFESPGTKVTPHFRLSWHNVFSRKIQTDSKFAGGLDLVRSTTTLPRSSLNAEIGIRFGPPAGDLTGHALLSWSKGESGRSAGAAAGLTYEF